MKGLYLIKILNRLSFIYAIISFLIANIDYRDTGAFTFIWQVLITYLIFRNRNGKISYVLMPFIFFPLIKISSTSLFISVVVIGAYAIFFALKGLNSVSYGMAIEEFEKSGIVIAILFGMSLIFINLGVLGLSSGHFIIIYLTSSIILLRLLRNIDYNKGDKRVEKINLVYSFILIGFTVMISISYVRDGIMKAVYASYIFITNSFMYIFSWVFLIVGIVMERLYRFLWSLMGKRSIEGSGINVNSGGQFKLDELYRKSLLEALFENTFINTALRVISIALVVYILVRIFKRASKGHILEEEDYTETKEFIGTGGLDINNLMKRAASLVKPLTNYEKIRFYYKKFLKKSIENGVSIEKSDTTLDVMGKTKYIFNNTSLNEMRNIYIKIRYGNFCANKEMLQRFIIYYRNMKDE